ncbi:hypothetical protein J7J26_03085 [Candidatus Micrarchaeota archaeon]|nr:hypothetical protein [Candidatus Micrarchaeota archaeon]
MKIRRAFLRNRDKKELSEILLTSFNRIFFNKKDEVGIELIDGKEVLIVNSLPYFILYKEDGKTIPLPTLKLIYKLLIDKIEILKSIIVDEGAIRFIISGANVMRPGIIHVDSDIKKGDILSIKDGNGRVLAVGKSLYSSDEINNMNSGIVVKNIHHIGDRIWNIKSRKSHEKA